jgi:4-amino-4-deoxy-L-arabinose transferase-like glycosyltransferase
VAWVVVFWGLDRLALQDPDEAHYAQLTREMLRAGSWFVPLLDGRPYIDKPVLFHWLQGLAVKLFGETETAVRLPSAFAAVALFWTTRWAGVRILDDRAGDRGAFMLATLPLTFVLASLGVFDMLFTAFLFGAVACLIVSAVCRRSTPQYVAYVLLTLAVMTKGPVALLLVVLFFLGGLLCGKECRTSLLSLRWKFGLCSVVMASMPWFVWMWLTFGGQFLQQYFLAGNLWYVTQPRSFSGREYHHTLYVSTFLAGFFPWSIILLGGAVDTFRRARSSATSRPGEILLWAWIATVFVFFSLARFKVDRYVYPAAPACCLLAGQAWMSISSEARRESTAPRTGAWWAAGVAGICLIGLGLAAAFSISRVGLDLPRVAVMIPISVVGGGVVLVATIVHRRAASPMLFGGLIMMLTIVYGSAVAIGFPVLERVRPTARVARQLSRQLQEGDRVALYRVEKWRSSLRYYLMRPVAYIEDPADLGAFLTRPAHDYSVMIREDYESLRQGGMRLRIVSARPAVTGTRGRGFRRQKWGSLVVVTTEDAN